MNMIERLKQIRLHTGLNQREYAEKIEVNLSNYRSYEQGIRRIYPETLVKINQFTNVNLHWLLTGEGEMIISDNQIIDIDSDTRKILKSINSDRILKAVLYNLLFESPNDEQFMKQIELLKTIIKN